MIDVVTNLLGETVQVSVWDGGFHVRGRGPVRAAYAVPYGLFVVVENELLYDDAVGRLQAFNIADCQIVVVGKCLRCLSWPRRADLKMVSTSGKRRLECKEGVGCRKVTTR